MARSLTGRPVDDRGHDINEPAGAAHRALPARHRRQHRHHAACLGIGVEIIEPAGFDMTDRALRRAGMDYVEMAALTRHVDWSAFHAWSRSQQRRLVLFTTQATLPYTRFGFRDDDVLLFGRESAGVPPAVHEAADARLQIPMPGGGRSLNLALAAAMAAGEALRNL